MFTHHTYDNRRRLPAQTCQYVARCIPYPVTIDANTFFLSFQYTDTDGTKQTVQPWEYGGQIARLDLAQAAEYERAWGLVDTHAEKIEAFIPYLARKEQQERRTFAELQDARGAGKDIPTYHEI